MNTLPKKKPAKRLLMPAILCIITVAACAAAGYYYIRMKQSESATGDISAAVRPAAPAVPVNPVFMSLDPFTVNLPAAANGDDGRVLYAGFTLRLPDEATKDRLTRFLPEVRSRLILLLTSQSQSALETEQGKYLLAGKIREVLTPAFASDLPPQVINDVLFTSFILR